jgi:hypothetical protein
VRHYAVFSLGYAALSSHIVEPRQFENLAKLVQLLIEQYPRSLAVVAEGLRSGKN